MESEYTLLEAAKALGITKNTVKYRLKKVPESMVRRGSDGVILISVDALAMIRRTTDKPVEHQIRTTKPPVDEVVSPSLAPYDKPSEEPEETGSPAPDLTAALQQTVDILREQLATKDKQIEDLTSALSAEQKHCSEIVAQLEAAQALHAAHMQPTLLEDPDKEKAPDTQPQSFWQRIWRAVKG